MFLSMILLKILCEKNKPSRTPLFQAPRVNGKKVRNSQGSKKLVKNEIFLMKYCMEREMDLILTKIICQINQQMLLLQQIFEYIIFLYI